MAIIVHGSAFITFEYANMKTLPIGSMIGQMDAAEFTSRDKHLVTITAGTDGILAVLPKGELKMEIRKSPNEVSFGRQIFIYSTILCVLGVQNHASSHS